jgi:hypothetical protein
MRRQRIPFTTAANGTASATGNTVSGGRLYAVIVAFGTLAANTDITLTTTGADGAATLLTLTNLTAGGTFYPRKLVQDAVGADIAGEYTVPLIDGKPTLAVTDGGNAKSGAVTLVYQE